MRGAHVTGLQLRSRFVRSLAEMERRHLMPLQTKDYGLQTPSPSFMPQRLDRIELRRAACREIAEHDSNGGRERERH